MGVGDAQAENYGARLRTGLWKSGFVDAIIVGFVVVGVFPVVFVVVEVFLVDVVFVVVEVFPVTIWRRVRGQFVSKFSAKIRVPNCSSYVSFICSPCVRSFVPRARSFVPNCSFICSPCPLSFIERFPDRMRMETEWRKMLSFIERLTSVYVVVAVFLVDVVAQMGSELSPNATRNTASRSIGG